MASSQVRTRVLRIVPSGRTMVFVAFKAFLSWVIHLGDWYAITNVAIEKDWFDGSLQHLCKLIWFSYNTSY